MSRPWRRPRSLTRNESCAKLVHHGSDDAGPGQDDLRALRLKADDRAPLRRVARAVQLDLAVDLGEVEDACPARHRDRTSSETCFTAAMLVIAPPIATSTSGAGRPSIRDRSAAMAASALRSTSGETALSSPNRSV